MWRRLGRLVLVATVLVTAACSVDERVLATVGDETVTPLTMLEARVNSVSIGSSGQDLLLNLEGLGSISFNDVAEIH